MILLLLAYLGGALTIVSPCILPVLPFVFSRADRPFLSNGLPILVGMALTFALVAVLAAVGGGWAVQANEIGRAAALALLTVFGLALLLPRLADRLTEPLVRLGGRLSATADAAEAEGGSAIGASLLLGVATGLLWAPCAGPILGLVLTGAALEGASVTTTLALLAYALGAATSLGLALVVGGRVFAAMKRSLGAGEWIRRGLGVAVLAGVAVVALGLDAGLLTRLSVASTTALEQGLVDRLRGQAPESDIVMKGPAMAAAGAMKGGMAMNGPATPSDDVVMKGPAMAAGGAMQGAMAMNGGAMKGAAMAPGAGGPTMMMTKTAHAADALPDEGPAPSLEGAVQWLNSPPLTMDELRGKVVLVDFWTYSCINCLRSIPYVRAWAEKYRDQGLVVIGVHAPEFAFEKSPDNVRKAVADLKIAYPVAIDNNYAIWRAFHNEYWPAHYFIDAEGRIRHHHFGEGDDEESERIIQQLLAETGRQSDASIVKVEAGGAQAAADLPDVQSPETYIGYERAQNFISPGGAVQDAVHDYDAGKPQLNEWGLSGAWNVGPERAALAKEGGTIMFRFHARDLHLVLSPGPGGQPAPFRVTIDGMPPGNAHGADVDAGGAGTVTTDRLYQLVRQEGPISDHLFQIEFLNPGVEAYAFTFG